MTRQLTSRTPADRKRALLLAGALIGVSLALGACQHTGDVVTTASVPDDYRLRHPIAIQEADRSIVVFVGRGRGGISAAQRADVMGLAQLWLAESNATKKINERIRVSLCDEGVWVAWGGQQHSRVHLKMGPTCFWLVLGDPFRPMNTSRRRGVSGISTVASARFCCTTELLRPPPRARLAVSVPPKGCK